MYDQDREESRHDWAGGVSAVIFGSFNCPYSFLASLRADRLKSAGTAAFEWRAVVHDPDVPLEGKPVTGELAEMFDRELEEIRGLLAPGEPYPARRPAVQPNTTAAVAAFSSTPADGADPLRRALFNAFWVDGADIGDRSVLDHLGCPAAGPGPKMRAWQRDWSETDRAIVPMMLLPDGRVSRGLGALARLAGMEAANRSSTT